MQYAKYGAKRYFDPRMQHVTKSQHSYVLISFFLTAVKTECGYVTIYTSYTI